MDTTLISYTPQSLIYGIAGAATGLTAVLVAVHIVSRRVARASVWWDDGLLWFGSAMTLAMNALFIYGAQLGLGRYEDQVSTSQLETIFKVLFSNNLLHLWAMALTKASLLLFFHRMFASSNKSLRWTVYFSLCLLFVWVATFSLINVFQCTPVSYFWDGGADGGNCMTADWTARTAIGICDTVFNVACDFLCLMAPFPVLRRLQLAKGKKACLAVVYLLGGCIVVLTVIRLLYQIDTPSMTSDDILYSTLVPTLFLIVETNLAIACACLPSFSVMNGRAIFIKNVSRPSTPESPYSRPGQQYSDTSLFLQEFKRQPLLTEWPILTTVTSYEPSARLPSLDFGNFTQESVTDVLKPAGGIIKTFNVEQVVERSDSIV